MATKSISINRAPVLTLWAAVVAERLGFDGDEALTLGRAVAGLNAQSKGRRLGIFKPSEERATKVRKKKPGETVQVEVLGRAVPAVVTENGVRALAKDKQINPDRVQSYLEGKFGEHLADARKAMERLARAFPPKELADHAYALYERFRPTIPAGKKGWGAHGELDLNQIMSLARKR
jgi:hypothetical protein